MDELKKFVIVDGKLQKYNGNEDAKITIPDGVEIIEEEAFEWCKENLRYIREQGKKNAKEIFEIRRWEVMAQGYKAMYEKCLQGEKK